MRSTKSSLGSIYKSGSPSTTTIQTVTAYVHDSSSEEESSAAPEQDETNDEEEEEEEGEEEEEEQFSNQFERMRLQVEEPAFLPQKSNDTSNSLSNSRQQLSMSIQNLQKLHNSSSTAPSTQPHSPVATTTSTAPGSSNESAMNSIGSSFSDLSGKITHLA